MGKPTGFMEYQRLSEAYVPVAGRLKNYHEFVATLGDDQAEALAKIAVSGRIVDVLVGPAGAGNTTCRI